MWSQSWIPPVCLQAENYRWMFTHMILASISEVSENAHDESAHSGYFPYRVEITPSP